MPQRRASLGTFLTMECIVPEKMKVVFDCSAKFEGTYLNEHLLPGPDLANALTGVLP